MKEWFQTESLKMSCLRKWCWKNYGKNCEKSLCNTCKQPFCVKITMK